LNDEQTGTTGWEISMNFNLIPSKFHFSARYWCLFCIVGGILLAGYNPVSGAEAPDITSLSPDTVHAGFSHLVTLTGQGFSEDMTIRFAKDDSVLNVTDVKNLSDTSVTFRVIVPADANPGLYQMILQSPSLGEHRYNQVFHVQPPAAPEIMNISPSSAMAGSSVPLQITGRYFRSGCTVHINQDTRQIPLTNLSVRYDQISGELILPTDTRPGSWNLSITNADGQEAVRSEGFTVIALPKPQILAITPDQGDMDVPVQVAVTGSNFLKGAIFSLSRNDLIVQGIDPVVDSPGRIIGTVKVPARYHEGLWDLTVTNPDGQSARKTNAYLSGEPYAPFNLQITPVWGIQGTERQVTIRGMSFLEGDRVTLQRGEKTISAKNITIVSPTQITCTIPIPENADQGVWDVVVTSRYNKSDILKGGFSIYTKTSLILSGIEPATGEQGQYLTATIGGNNLENGSSVMLTASGEDQIQSESTALVRPDELKAWFHIPSDAMPDLYDLTVIFPSGQKLVKTGAFRILYNNTPVIESIEPDRAQVGTEDLKITVTGKNFGDGEYLNLNLTHNATTIPVSGAVSYKGTRITGYLTIPNGTWTGWYDLDVTRDAGRGRSATKSEMFRVL
jgi:hypothetical protein